MMSDQNYHHSLLSLGRSRFKRWTTLLVLSVVFVLCCGGIWEESTVSFVRSHGNNHGGHGQGHGKKDGQANRQAVKLHTWSNMHTKLERFVKSYEQMSSEARARILAGVAFKNTCRTSQLTSLLQTYQSILDELTSIDSSPLSASIAELEDKVDSLLTSLQSDSCSQLAIQISADAKQQKSSFSIKTDQCVTAMTDSCCFKGLLFTSACSMRDITVNNIYYSNSPTANANCATPRSVESQVTKMVQVRADKCLSSFQDQFDTANAMIDYYSSVFEPLFSDDQWKSCSSGADCPSGSCNAESGYCNPVSTGLTEQAAIGDYLKHALGNDLTRLLVILNLKDDASSQDIGKAFQQAVTSERCVDVHGNPVSSHETTSKASCESQTTCNNPNLTNDACTGSTGFCGAKCSPYCQSVVEADEAKCASGILCTDTLNGNMSFASDAQSCKSAGSGRCSIECASCTTKSTCESSVQCIADKYPELTQFIGKCLVPFSISKTGQRTCPSGTISHVNPLGCISKDAKASCNGLFIDPGKDCSSINFCERRDPLLGTVVSTLGEDDCKKLDGSMVPAFKPKHGTWISSNAPESGVLEWRTPQLVKKNSWITALDETLLSNLVFKLASNIFNLAVKDFLSCAVNPILQTSRVTSCDCGTDRSSKVCFNSGMVIDKANVASSANRDVTVPFSRASLLVPRGSTTATTPISLTEYLMSAPSPRKTVSGVPVLTIPVQNQFKATVGQIVGNGYSIDRQIAGAKLCIQIDPTVKIEKDEYVNGAFATRSSDGKYMLAPVKMEKADTETVPSTICGYISDTQVYYPAAVLVEADTRKGDASMAKYNMFATVFVLALGWIIISKQQ